MCMEVEILICSHFELVEIQKNSNQIQISNSYNTIGFLLTKTNSQMSFFLSNVVVLPFDLLHINISRHIIDVNL
jgi:hypothetical protein